MSYNSKIRSAQSIVNKVHGNPKFQQFLEYHSSNMNHFSTLLHQEGADFMEIYNSIQSKNLGNFSAAQKERGLTNSVKLASQLLVELVSKQFPDDAGVMAGIVEYMIDFQLPLLDQGNLRFSQIDKTPALAAVWYSYVTSPRKETAAMELAESYYDILWMFLEPIENARQISFDRAQFATFLENQMTNRRQVTTKAPATKNTLDNIIRDKKTKYFQVMSSSGAFTNSDEFRNFMDRGASHQYNAMQMEAPQRWIAAAEKSLTQQEFGHSLFTDVKAFLGVFSGITMLPLFSGLHDRYLTGGMMFDIVQHAQALFVRHGWEVDTNVERADQASTIELANFNMWTAINSYAKKVVTPVNTRGEFHLHVGIELALLAENIVFTLECFYKPGAGDHSERDIVVRKAIDAVLVILASESLPLIQNHEISNGTITSTAAAFPVNSIYQLGAVDFYSNLIPIITKETEMTKQALAAQANQSTASSAAAEAANPDQGKTLTIEEQLHALMQGMEAGIKNAMAEGHKELTNSFDKKIEKLNKRIGDLEMVTAKSVDPSKTDKNEVSKEALERIKTAAQASTKAAKKEKKKSKDNFAHMSTTEQVIVYGGAALAVAAIGYGAYKLGEFLLED